MEVDQGKAWELERARIQMKQEQRAAMSAASGGLGHTGTMKVDELIPPVNPNPWGSLHGNIEQPPDGLKFWEIKMICSLMIAKETMKADG